MTDLGSKNPLQLAHSGYQDAKIFGTKVWGGSLDFNITCWLYLGQERLTPKYRLLHSGVSGWTKKVKYKASRNKRCFTLIQSLMRYSKSHFTNTEAFLTLNVIIHSKVNNMYHRQNQILVFALDTDKTV